MTNLEMCFEEEVGNFVNTLEMCGFTNVKPSYSVGFSQGDGARFLAEWYEEWVHEEISEDDIYEPYKEIVSPFMKYIESDSPKYSAEIVATGFGAYVHEKTMDVNIRRSHDDEDEESMNNQAEYFLQFIRDISRKFHSILENLVLSQMKEVGDLLEKYNYQNSALTPEMEDMYVNLLQGGTEFYFNFGMPIWFARQFEDIMKGEAPHGFRVQSCEIDNSLRYVDVTYTFPETKVQADTVKWIIAGAQAKWDESANKSMIDINANTVVSLHTDEYDNVILFEAECGDMYVKCQTLDSFQRFLAIMEEESYVEET